MPFVLLIILLIYGGSCLYLARGLLAPLRCLLPRLRGWLFFLCTLPLWLSVPLSFLWKWRPVKLLSAYCMGILFCLLLAFVAVDLVSLFLRRRHRKHPTFKTFRGLTAIALTVVLSISGFAQGSRLETVTYDLRQDPSATPLRVVLITDLHLGAAGSEERLDSIVKTVNAQEPDVICIAGDLIDSDFRSVSDPEAAADLLRQLRSVYGVYACLGNHDSGKTFSDMLAFFDKADITLLRDEFTVIEERFVLAGRRDLSPIGDSGEKRSDTAEFLATLPETDLPVIVMDHNPKEATAYEAPVDLVLSGHTHRGQVFPGSLITDWMYTVDYGVYQWDANAPHVVVSSGAGTWGMPMRIGTQCEVVTILI